MDIKKIVVKKNVTIIAAIIGALVLMLLILLYCNPYLQLIPSFGYNKLKEIEIYNTSSPVDKDNMYFEREVKIDYFVTEEGFFKSKYLYQTFSLAETGEQQLISERLSSECDVTNCRGQYTVKQVYPGSYDNSNKLIREMNYQLGVGNKYWSKPY
jgi:hypothetical protein